MGDNENKTKNENEDSVTNHTTENLDNTGKITGSESTTEVSHNLLNASIGSESITEIIHNLFNASAVLKSDTTSTPDLKERNINVFKKYLSSVQDSFKLNKSDTDLTMASEKHPHHLSLIHI